MKPGQLVCPNASAGINNPNAKSAFRRARFIWLSLMERPSLKLLRSRPRICAKAHVMWAYSSEITAAPPNSFEKKVEKARGLLVPGPRKMHRYRYMS